MLHVNRAANRVPWFKYRIGNREIVGPNDGVPEYFDLVDIPCPSIRYKEPNAEINALRAKEQGSWKAMTIDEKKQLYRASFCRTFSEMQAPTCEYRRVFGNTMMFLSLPIIAYIIIKNTILSPMPESMSDHHKKLMVRFWIDNRAGEFYKVWDYDNQKWLKKPFTLIKKE